MGQEPIRSFLVYDVYLLLLVLLARRILKADIEIWRALDTYYLDIAPHN